MIINLIQSFLINFFTQSKLNQENEVKWVFWVVGAIIGSAIAIYAVWCHWNGWNFGWQVNFNWWGFSASAKCWR